MSTNIENITTANPPAFIAKEMGIVQMPAIRQESVPAVSGAEGIMNMIIKAGETMDPARISALMDLQERVLNREAKQAFDADYVRMKPLLPLVVKTHKNSHTNSKYAKLEDINKIIDPILSEYGFGTATDILEQTDTYVKVEAQLIHGKGHTKTTSITMPMDNVGAQGTVNKTGPHAVSSSVTYAKRVAICALLNISTGDDNDGNSDKGEDGPLDNEVAVALDLKINALPDVADYKPKFLKYMKVEGVHEIKKSDFKKALTALEAKEKEAKKAGGK